MNSIKEINRINERELQLGVKGSWHDQYKDSAYIFVGGLAYEMTEGDVIAIFSQWGEVIDINLPRAKDTGKQRGFGFLMYEDQRSTVLAVDNMNGAVVAGRTIRVDHCRKYEQKGQKNEEGEYVAPEEPTYNAMPPTIEGSSGSESESDASADDLDEEDPMAAFLRAERKKQKRITGGTDKDKDKDKDKKRKRGETKEERRARKEQKRAKRAEKERRRAEKEKERERGRGGDDRGEVKVEDRDERERERRYEGSSRSRSRVDRDYDERDDTRGRGNREESDGSRTPPRRDRGIERNGGSGSGHRDHSPDERYDRKRLTRSPERHRTRDDSENGERKASREERQPDIRTLGKDRTYDHDFGDRRRGEENGRARNEGRERREREQYDDTRRRGAYEDDRDDRRRPGDHGRRENSYDRYDRR